MAWIKILIYAQEIPKNTFIVHVCCTVFIASPLGEEGDQSHSVRRVLEEDRSAEFLRILLTSESRARRRSSGCPEAAGRQCWRWAPRTRRSRWPRRGGPSRGWGQGPGRGPLWTHLATAAGGAPVSDCFDASIWSWEKEWRTF
ncbi:hypothetical protein CEXT_178151 [Caerostris extrusa]|uniref:Uncharacterized protein n=1 Tax=Caerostris extrusa TaxID=172846 RepID=A0AAV4XUY5_CAEEX|nr:hypothetical protein CEXT_178151 [Caerostris extrusa]